MSSRTLLKTREVAELFGNSERTIKRWRQAGYGPTPIRVGPRSIRYELADVEAFLDSGKVHRP